MKKFIYALLLFLLFPVLILFMVEVIFPPTLFTFRGYEALIFNSNIPHLGPYYPNSKIYKLAEGDMCQHTRFAIKKEELWITDKIGFRNDTFIKNPDILFLGNSFIYGTGSTQKDIISNQVKNKLNGRYRVYNMGPSNLGEFDYFLKRGIIKKPKLIVYSIGEVHVLSNFKPYEKETESILKKYVRKLCYSGLNTWIDRAMRLYSLKWIKSRINGVKNFGVQTSLGGTMFFGQGTKMKTFSEEEINESVKSMMTYQTYCDSLGIKFLYLPTPNKETVYWERIPFDKQPDYFFKLKAKLDSYKINGINTLELFADYRKNNDKLLYHLDDTHWNSLGVKVVSGQIANYINNNLR